MNTILSFDDRLCCIEKCISIGLVYREWDTGYLIPDNFYMLI